MQGKGVSPTGRQLRTVSIVNEGGLLQGHSPENQHKTAMTLDVHARECTIMYIVKTGYIQPPREEQSHCHKEGSLHRAGE